LAGVHATTATDTAAAATAAAAADSDNDAVGDAVLRCAGC